MSKHDNKSNFLAALPFQFPTFLRNSLWLMPNNYLILNNCYKNQVFLSKSNFSAHSIIFSTFAISSYMQITHRLRGGARQQHHREKPSQYFSSLRIHFAPSRLLIIFKSMHNRSTSTLNYKIESPSLFRAHIGTQWLQVVILFN